LLVIVALFNLSLLVVQNENASGAELASVDGEGGGVDSDDEEIDEPAAVAKAGGGQVSVLFNSTRVIRVI
jgi:hypothetical protein